MAGFAGTILQRKSMDHQFDAILEVRCMTVVEGVNNLDAVGDGERVGSHCYFADVAALHKGLEEACFADAFLAEVYSSLEDCYLHKGHDDDGKHMDHGDGSYY